MRTPAERGLERCIFRLRQDVLACIEALHVVMREPEIDHARKVAILKSTFRTWVRTRQRMQRAALYFGLGMDIKKDV
jgi:hypothetical protein